MATRDNPLSMLTGQLSAVLRQTMYQRYHRYSTGEQWTPAVNIYQLPDRLEICVELAGVDREQIELTAEPGRLLLRGVRKPPEPCCKTAGGPRAMRILNMEIDAGPFERVIALPQEVQVDRIESHMHDGMLRIALPLKQSG